MNVTEEKIYSDDNLKVNSHKCPNCGGESVFDPKEQKLRCLYCGSLFEIKNDIIIEERNLDELLQKGKVWTEVEVYQCQSCGAKEIIDNQEVSMKCPFCGTSNIIKTSELPGLKPQGVIPFKIGAKTTTQIAIKWAKGKVYAPKVFKNSVKPNNIHGVYNPIFTFDASTKSDYNGQLAKNHIRYRIVNGRRESYTETKYFYIQGQQVVNFDDLLIQASTMIPSYVIKDLQPFPTKKAIQYKTAYLKGYAASSYNKDGNSCWDECKNEMKNRIENQILKKYNYDYKIFLNVKTLFLSESYKYILIPIYIGHYNYKKKLYNFYVNGYTGKIVGKTPVSALKVFFTVFGILLTIGLIIAFIFLMNS